MRYSAVFSLLLLILLTLGGCKKDNAPAVPDALFGQDWHNTKQQGLTGFYIYKPLGTFQPQGGWGIDGFRFERGGSFVLHTSGPADGPLDIPGSWQAEGDDSFRIELSNGQPPYTLTIKALDANTLQVWRP